MTSLLILSSYYTEIYCPYLVIFWNILDIKRDLRNKYAIETERSSVPASGTDDMEATT